MSASFPASIEPTTSDMPCVIAGLIVYLDIYRLTRKLSLVWRQARNDHQGRNDHRQQDGRPERIDTNTAGGELVFHLFGAMAQFERSLAIERTRAGLASAKQRGVKLGRKRSLTDQQIVHARQLIDAGESPPEVAKSLGVSRSTLWRALAALTSSKN